MNIRELRLALRQLHKNPGFALAVVVTLALGIGVNAAVFSLVDGFLLRPLPYPQADRLGVLLLHREGVSPEMKTARMVRRGIGSGTTCRQCVRRPTAYPVG